MIEELKRNLPEQLAVLPANLANHLLLTVVALGIGLSLSLPLGVLIARRQKLRYPAMTVVSVIQTIPGLALLALMVPLLAGVGALLARVGIEISALGFWPAVIALTLYSMLPAVRNTITGLLGVDAAVIEAARAAGMTDRQRLLRVELPLALPVIIAGIRTAAVWVVGIATLSTPVGQRSLGNFIFRGLQTRNWTMVLVGCISAALLAILLDLLIGGLERAAAERRRRLGWSCAVALGFVVFGGLASPSLVRAFGADRRDAQIAQVARPPEEERVLRIGSKTFTEQYILAALIEDVLRGAGHRTREVQSLGSTIIFDALASGDLDVYVDYSGTVWTNHMRRSGRASREEVLEGMSWWLAHEHGIRSLGSLGFENAYALAMRREHAERLGVRTLADLKEHAPELKIGGDYEFFGRPEWRSVRDTYQLRFSDQISYDPAFMYDALVNRAVDVISAFSSDGRIATFDLVTLDDPEQSLPPYDAVLLVSRQIAESDAVIAALRPLVGAIGVEEMRAASAMVDREEGKQTVEQAARWLRAEIRR